MPETLDAFTMWLKATELSEAIRNSQWLWPVCEIAHFTGLSLLVGAIGFFDLRLLGAFRAVPLQAAWSFMPWGKLGFAIAAVTGVIFFVGAPDQYINNVAFYAKLAFLVLAGINAAVFELFYKRALATSPGAETSPALRTIAIVSIVSWFFVIYWGRMLPFVGNAF